MQNAPRVLILNHDNWARPYCTGKEDDEVPEGHSSLQLWKNNIKSKFPKSSSNKLKFNVKVYLYIY